MPTICSSCLMRDALVVGVVGEMRLAVTFLGLLDFALIAPVTVLRLA